MTAAITTIERASAISGYPLAVLRGPCRLRPICLIRWAAMTAMRRKGMSYPAIGRAIHRNHATVINGVRQARRYAARDAVYAAFLERLAG